MTVIAICSDSHDNIENIDKFILFCKKNKIKTMLHCGDITSKQTKKYFEENFQGEKCFIDGNAETTAHLNKKTNRFQKLKKPSVPYLELEIDKLKIAICHKKDKALRLANKNKYDFVFYGHTHLPWQEKILNTQVINPGTLAGMFTPPTFALLDTKTKTLKLILVNKL